MHTDHYATLGLPRNAKTSHIKVRFKQLAKTYHPDRAGDTEKMSAINSAYAILADPKRRFAYDRTLAEKAAPKTTPQNYQSAPAPSQSFATSHVPTNAYNRNDQSRATWYTALGVSAAVLALAVVALTSLRNTGQTTTVINSKARTSAAVAPAFARAAPTDQTALNTSSTPPSTRGTATAQSLTVRSGSSSNPTQYQSIYRHHKDRLNYWQNN
jgi:curved DNA-binding protein CbpA